MSEAQKRRPPPSEETLARLRVAQLGKKASPETRQKLSAIHKGHTIPREAIERARAARVGKKRTEEQKARMRAGWTPEARAKVSANTSEANKRRVGMKYKPRKIK